MKNLLLALLLCVTGCATPVKVIETYVTDSTGKTTKVIQKFYDSTRNDRWDYYQDDYVNLMVNPYMYYDPFFYDPFWRPGRMYFGPRVIVPVNPPRAPRVSPREPRGGGPGYINPPSRPKPGVGTNPRYSPPRPLPPGPRGSYTPQPRSFSPPPAPRPVERGSSPIREFVKPDNKQ